MRAVLVGAVESTAVALEVLSGSPISLEAVVTLPGDRLSRHSDARVLSDLAEPLGIRLVEATNINDPETLDTVRELRPDLTFVIGWSQICRAEFLGIATVGSVGYHPTALPENRGRAVIPWTILRGMSETGSTLFWMDDGMDSGDILFQERFAVDPAETATTLYAKHMDSLRRMLVEVCATPQSLPRTPQEHEGATYCARRVREDGLIDWTCPAEDVHRLIRATTRPYPGAYTRFEGDEIVIWSSRVVEDAPYIGIPGQIQAFRPEGPVLQCGGDSHLLITEATRPDGTELDVQSVMRRHQRFG